MRNPFTLLSALALAILVGLGVIVALAVFDGSDQRPALAANWTAPTLFIAANGRDAGNCPITAPCRSMNYAALVAADGDTVSVAADNFGTDSVGDTGSKHIRFLAKPGNRFTQLVLSGSNVTYDGLNVDASCTANVGGCPSNGAAKLGGPLVDMSGDGDAFINGSVGNITDAKGLQVSGQNVTVDHNRFHDVYQVGDNVHNECVYAIVVSGFVFTHNTTTNCATMDLFFTYGYWWTPMPPNYGNVLIDGNTFMHSTCPGCTLYLHPGWHAYGLYIGYTGNPSPGTLNNWTVSNNYFENDATVTPADAGGNVFCGNTGRADASWTAPCAGGTTTTTPTTVPTTTASTTTATTTTTPTCDPLCKANDKITRAIAILKKSGVSWYSRDQQALKILQAP